MAQITKKKSARHRIQISMRPELHTMYTSYRKKAEALGLEIDFKHNFEQWFEGQLEQLGRELDNHARLSATDQPDLNTDGPGTLHTSQS
jgi:hypothetical protein